MFRLRPLPRSLAAALRDAAHKKPEIRRSATADLGRFQGSEEQKLASAQLLQSARHDDDHRVRAAAALSLADLGDRGAVSTLLEAAEDAHPRVRQMSLLALGEIGAGATAVTDKVRNACRDPLPGLRFQALIALRQLEGEGALEQLRDALVDEDAKVRYIAVRLLEEIGAKGTQDENLQQGLRVCLRDGDGSVALAAALLLAPGGNADAQEIIIEALNARRRISDPEDEEAAISLAGDLHLEAAAPGLRRRLGGWLVRRPFDWQARVALCRLGDRPVVERALAELHSRNPHMRLAAIAAVKQAALAEALPVLEGMTAASDEEAEARQSALESIAKAVG